MPVFAYIATDADRVTERGTIAADTARTARDQLRDRGLVLQQVRALARSTGSTRWQAYLRRRNQGQLVPAIRELSTLLGVGIALLDALDEMIRQARGPLKRCLLRLRDRVSEGAGLAEAMAEQPQWFDQLSMSITAVGENAGSLDEALVQLAQFKEKAMTFRSRIGSALLYPAIVLAMAIGVSLFLMTFVVPKLLVGLEQAGRRPPLITQVVKALSDGLIGYWWALLIAAAALVGAAGALLCTPRGRWWADALMLRLPLIGLMLRKQAVVRIATVIAALMRSGIEFVAAVRIAQRTTGNRVLRAALGRCEQAVVAGQDIGAALEATGAFPRTAVQVFAIGQQAGRLEPMLERLAADYDRQLTSLTGRLVSLLEPLLIVIMVLIVGFIAFATILPMLEASHVLT